MVLHNRQRVLTLKRNFAWSLVGNAVYSLGLWLLLVVLARLSSQENVGKFALALAITAPVFLTVGLNLRVVQATDARRTWRRADYLRLRHLLNVVSIVVSLLVGGLLGLDRSALLVLVMVSGAKASEALSQTYYGYCQLFERMDIVARSMLLRAALGLLLFSLILGLTDRLVYACAGLWLGWVVTLFIVDRPAAGKLEPSSGPSRRDDLRSSWSALFRLARRALPLGVDAGLSSLALNVPRYLVAVLLGAALLGQFASVAYFAQAVSMVTGALGQAVVPRLATNHEQRQRTAFLRLLSLLTLFGVAVTVAAVVAAALVGDLFIRWTLGPEYVDTSLLVTLMFSTGLITLQRSLGRALQAAQRFTAYLMTDVVTVVVIAATGPVLVTMYGVVGAAMTLCVGFSAGIVATLVCLPAVLRTLDDTACGHERQD